MTNNRLSWWTSEKKTKDDFLASITFQEILVFHLRRFSVNRQKTTKLLPKHFFELFSSKTRKKMPQTCQNLPKFTYCFFMLSVLMQNNVKSQRIICPFLSLLHLVEFQWEVPKTPTYHYWSENRWWDISQWSMTLLHLINDGDLPDSITSKTMSIERNNGDSHNYQMMPISIRFP